MKREKEQDQERILAEHLDGLERSEFCDFDKPCKRAYQKGKIEFVTSQHACLPHAAANKRRTRCRR